MMFLLQEMMDTTFRVTVIKPITRICDSQIIIDATLASDDGHHIHARYIEFVSLNL